MNQQTALQKTSSFKAEGGNRMRGGNQMWGRYVIQSCALVLLLAVTSTGAAGSDIADAVMKGDQKAVRARLQRGTDVNAPQADGSTALHWAIYQDDLDTADLLIRAGANPRAANLSGATVLSLAAINGNAAMIERLLSAGADPNERGPNGETPLMMAARNGNVDAIKVLVERGADVNAKEKLRGTTALMWAAANANPTAVEALIGAGADAGARSNNTASRGRTARDSPSPAERLSQEAGARLKDLAAAKPQAAQVQAALALAAARAPAAAARREGGGLTALVFAARQGDIESARILLAAGADVNQVTADGWSPLLTATHNRYYRLASFLLDKGADPNIANKSGWTPLYLATDNRNVEGGEYPTRIPDMDQLEFIRKLLDKGANVNARTIDDTETRTHFTGTWLPEDGATPFLRAAQSGDITLLLELGADVNAINDDRRTALMGAAFKGATEVVQILVDHGAGWMSGTSEAGTPSPATGSATPGRRWIGPKVWSVSECNRPSLVPRPRLSSAN
jgi:ankyrin